MKGLFARRYFQGARLFLQAHWPKAANSGGVGAGPQGITGEPGGRHAGLPEPGRDSPGGIHGPAKGLAPLGARHL
jgi:hypothetical protein